MRAITQGKDEVVQTGCEHVTADGELVMFSCDLQSSGLPIFRGSADFTHLQFQGIGLRTEAEILQCVEHTHTETREDRVGGGTTEITTYTYHMEWRGDYLD